MKLKRNTASYIQLLLLSTAITLLPVNLWPETLTPYQLSLKRAIELAIKNSKKLQLKETDFQTADILYKKERTKLFPKIELEASSSYLTNPKEGVTIHKGEFGYSPSVNSEYPIPFPDRDYPLIEDQKNTYFKITAKLTQPLFTWNKIKNAIEIAKIERDIKLEELKKEKRETEKEVKTFYYTSLLALKSQEKLKTMYSIVKGIVKDKENSYKEGIINLQELLEAKSQLAQIEKKLIEAEESYKTAITSLKILTGLYRPQLKLELTTPFPKKYPQIEEKKLLSRAILFSPEIKTMNKKLLQSNRYLEIQKSSAPLIPDFSLIVTMDITGQKIPIVEGNWSDYWENNFIFTIGTKLKIFDSGETKYEIERAKKSVQSAVTGIESYKQLVTINLRKTIQELTTNYYSIREKEALLKEARETEKNAAVSYKNELITREQMGKAKILLISNELEYLLSQFNYEESLNNLEYLVNQNLRQ